MTRISDPVVNFDGHNGGGFVIIAESHVAIEQCFQNGVYNGFIDIETCAPERLDQDRVLRYAREALHFWADRTRQLRRQSLVQ
jgi:S-adenosylmethionine/arginine decarboxylase-like enzyme